jgi:hypothetical protein
LRFKKKSRREFLALNGFNLVDESPPPEPVKVAPTGRASLPPSPLPTFPPRNEDLYGLGMDNGLEIEPGPDRFDWFKETIAERFSLDEETSRIITSLAEKEMNHRVKWHRERRKGTYAWAHATKHRLSSIIVKRDAIIVTQGRVIRDRNKKIVQLEAELKLLENAKLGAMYGG